MWFVEGHSNMALAKNLVFLFLCHLLLPKADANCQPSFQCGNWSMKFPFSNIKDPGCGLVQVGGCDSEHPEILSIFGRTGYRILNMTPPNKLRILDPDLPNQLKSRDCLFYKYVHEPDFPSISFRFSPNLTLFTCSNQTYSKPIEEHFQNYNHTKCGISTVYYKTLATAVPATEESRIPQGCLKFQLPIKSPKNSSDLFNLLTAEFAVEWNVSEACSRCYHRGGQCLANTGSSFKCKEKGNRTFQKTFLIGGVTMAALSIFLILFIQRKCKLLRLFGIQKAKPENRKDIELFLKNNGNLVPIRYNYSDIKKMTKSFSEMLGKGGYGSVYKGKLLDGRLVAVKILNESKGNGEEFINEVASISRTSHINIVSLLGFCFEGSKSALIYEFMPNGSLEKFIQNTTSSSTIGGVLGWQKLFEIALGIARGLEYLHQGCKTRILHFDIKPHNILLDKEFNPRISDFGLAKLCPNRSSIVSMLVARGTIGYIAPEVFCRNFGEVSHKSDVYSYGMMILEIVGGRKNIDPRNESTSDVYFPQYIYKQLEMDVERDGSRAEIITEVDSQSMKRKLIIVGLWCIQTDPNNRPSMTRVVGMLEGKVESLQVPPKPYLSSPPRSVQNFSTFEHV